MRTTAECAIQHNQPLSSKKSEAVLRKLSQIIQNYRIIGAENMSRFK